MLSSLPCYHKHSFFKEMIDTSFYRVHQLYSCSASQLLQVYKSTPCDAICLRFQRLFRSKCRGKGFGCVVWEPCSQYISNTRPSRCVILSAAKDLSRGIVQI